MAWKLGMLSLIQGSFWYVTYDYGVPKFYKIVNHKQPGTGFWPWIPMTTLYLEHAFVIKIIIWTHKGQTHEHAMTYDYSVDKNSEI